MSRADGILVVTLTHKWWDMIDSGVKLEEYRGKNWAYKMLREHIPKRWPRKLKDYSKDDYEPYHTLRAQRAYSGIWLERKIKGIRWGAPKPEWCGSDMGDCFIIELEPKP